MTNDIDFIHIGYHKTASSYLQLEYFKKYNSLLCANCEENKINSWVYNNLINIDPYLFEASKFKDEFCRKVNFQNQFNYYISEENLSGDIYSGIDSSLIMRRIYEAFGKTKILIVIRNQIDWLLSAYSNYVIDGGVKSIEKWLFSPLTKNGQILEKIKYSRLIKAYQELYGTNNIHVICYENLWSETKGIQNFLKNIINLDENNIEVKEKSYFQVGRSLRANNFLRNINKFSSLGFKGKQKLFSFLPREHNLDRNFLKGLLNERFKQIIEDNLLTQILIKQDLPKVYFKI